MIMSTYSYVFKILLSLATITSDYNYGSKRYKLHLSFSTTQTGLSQHRKPRQKPQQMDYGNTWTTGIT